MTVEAAMILPVFLLFVVFLIYIVKMAFITMALQVTVSNTVKQLATHMYPVAMVIDQQGEAEGAGKKSGTNPGDEVLLESGGQQPAPPKLTFDELADTYNQLFPPPIGDWIKSTDLYGQFVDAAHQAAGDTLVKPLMKPYMQDTILNIDRIHVTRVTLPQWKKKENMMIALEVSYTMPMRVPFLSQALVLQAKAAERVWVGDTSQATPGDGEGGDESGRPQIVSIEPNPLKPGSRAKIKVKVAPNQTSHVTVFYKSGESTAKFLGDKTADVDGYIEWEWHVSGNTTKGSTVKIVVETAEGNKTETQIQVKES
ncbi:hypothetical protein BVG16_17440 [Paenibacillus selenitireducens]|uniref:Pilus assembly protein n=2 Tax=Paenibacillus selenitireducens TaxID=1324314 RepID=A0A1T2XBC3_9BACL|nr:hypothetical protein BVG16_17440 [Paenibacillus selenitireducens]